MLIFVLCFCCFFGFVFSYELCGRGVEISVAQWADCVDHLMWQEDGELLPNPLSAGLV